MLQHHNLIPKSKTLCDLLVTLLSTTILVQNRATNRRLVSSSHSSLVPFTSFLMHIPYLPSFPPPLFIILVTPSHPPLPPTRIHPLSPLVPLTPIGGKKVLE